MRSIHTNRYRIIWSNSVDLRVSGEVTSVKKCGWEEVEMFVRGSATCGAQTSDVKPPIWVERTNSKDFWRDRREGEHGASCLPLAELQCVVDVEEPA